MPHEFFRYPIIQTASASYLSEAPVAFPPRRTVAGESRVFVALLTNRRAFSPSDQMAAALRRGVGQIAALGFDAASKRPWDCYPGYCEAGFPTGTIDVGLYVIEHRV